MGKIITLGIQKGGCSKSTTSGIIAFELARRGKKVLVVDMDSQGNLTELMSEQPANEFEDVSVLEAMKDKNAEDYTFPVQPNIDLIPANNLLSLLPRYLYLDYLPKGGNPNLLLRDTLASVVDNYDYIIIDTPPSLSEHTVNALCASDFVVILFEASKWCWSAIPNFIDTVNAAIATGNPNLKIAGILRTLTDTRRFDVKTFSEQLEDEYGDLVFNTVIRRKASTGRLSFFGFSDNAELRDAVEQYKPFIEELIERVESR